VPLTQTQLAIAVADRADQTRVGAVADRDGDPALRTRVVLDLDRRERRRRKAEVQDAETVQANFVPPLASCRVTSAIKSPRTASTVFFDRSCPSTNSAKLGATSAPPSTGSATTKITCYASEYAVVLNIPPLDD